MQYIVVPLMTYISMRMMQYILYTNWTKVFAHFIITRAFNTKMGLSMKIKTPKR